MGADSLEEEAAEADAEFEPSLTNTVLFLLSSAMLLTTFAVNYTGRPFMGALSSNKSLAGTLTGGAVLVALLTSGALPALSEYLELVPLPQDGVDSAGFGSNLLALMAFDFALCFAADKGSAKLLGSLYA